MSTEIPVQREQSYEPQYEIDPPVESPEDVGAGLRPARRQSDGPAKKFRGPDQKPDSSLLRHVTHCSICNHPDREAIEQSILHWYSPTVIAHEFDLADRRIVYRHAHALSLFQRRAEQSRHALGFLIEQAQSIVPSADAIIRAVRALACIDDHGHWHEPRKEVIITHRYENGTSQSAKGEDADPMSRFERANNTIGVASEASLARNLQRESGPARSTKPACTECRERARRDSRTPRRRARRRSLGGRSLSAVAGFSSDKQPAPSSGVSTPEGTETQRKSWSPLRLFSTRLLRKDRRNPNRINKTAKTSRHTFAVS